MANLSGLFRIGRDAEVRYVPSGEAVVGLSLAFNYYDKNAEKNRASQWIEAALWGKRAESLAPYLKKGGQVFAVIEDPHIETYEGKNGAGVKLAGKVAAIELAGRKTEPDAPNARSEQPAPRSAPRPAPGNNNPFDDNDIPF